MKITVLCLAALFTTAPLALTQEVTSSPDPETTPSDPTVSVTTEKTASPTPKPKPSASPTKSSSPAAAKSSPSPSPSSSSPAAAVMPVKKSSAEATIREIEEKWEGSVKTHDASIPQMYLADDFRGVSS